MVGVLSLCTRLGPLCPATLLSMTPTITAMVTDHSTARHDHRPAQHDQHAAHAARNPQHNSHLSVMDAARVAYVYATAGVYDPPLFSAIAARVTSSLQGGSETDATLQRVLPTVLWAMEQVGCSQSAQTGV